MDDGFDIIILGTGLSESIAATALAKAGLKVAHIDPNPYYGADEATLALDELIQWAETHASNPNGEHRIDYLSPGNLSYPKQYSISLSPSIIPSVGSFISSIISSGVFRYGSYKLLGPAGIYRDGTFQSVPQSKESIFQDKSIPLVEKRRLMRFLMFASGEFEESPELQGKENAPFDHFIRESFSLSEEISQVIMFSLACCNFSGEPALPSLHRVRDCLRASGRYGPSPFLVGYYGGIGEIIQGFCRATAVNGGVYILGRNISKVEWNETQKLCFSIELEDIPDPLQSSCILSSTACVPDTLRSRVDILPNSNIPGTSRSQIRAMARCIAILDGPIKPPRFFGTDDDSLTDGQSDSYLIVFPPGSLDGGSLVSSVTLLTAGAGTLSAPSDKNIIYLSMPLHDGGRSSKDLLAPYLTRLLDLNPTIPCVFQLFYMQTFPTVTDQPFQDPLSKIFVFPQPQPDVLQTVDQAAYLAETAFWSAIRAVDPQRVMDGDRGIWMDRDVDSVSEQDAE